MFTIWDGSHLQRRVDATTSAAVHLSGSAFSPDGRYLLTGYSTHTSSSSSRTPDDHRKHFEVAHYISLWDVATGKEVRRFTPRSALDPINVLAFSPDGKRAVSATGHPRVNRGSCGMEASVRLWDVATGQELASVPCLQWSQPHGAKIPLRVSCAAFSPDGRSVLVATDSEDYIHYLSLLNPRFPQAQANAAAYCKENFAITIWDAQLRKQLGRLVGHMAPVRHIVFSPDGRYAFTASGRSHKEQAAGGHGLAIGNDDPPREKWFADSSIRQWDLRTGKQVRSFKGIDHAVCRLAVSPDGRYLLSGGNDRLFRLWDVATGKEMHRFNGHQDWLESAAFTPDSRHVLIGGRESIRLWEVASGREVLTVRPRLVPGGGSSPSIHQTVAFSPDGQQAYTVSMPFLLPTPEVRVEVWDLPSLKAAPAQGLANPMPDRGEGPQKGLPHPAPPTSAVGTSAGTP